MKQTISRTRFKKLILIVCIFYSQFFPVFSQNISENITVVDKSIYKIAENNDVRKSIYKTLLTKQLSPSTKNTKNTYRNNYGSWQVQTEKNGNTFFIIIKPQNTNNIQGTWIISREIGTGNFIQAIIYPKNDPEIFARIYPFGSRSQIDIITYNGVLYKEVIIPIPFSDVIIYPIKDIIKLTENVIKWDYFAPDPALYKTITSFLELVETKLPEIRFADDGAIDYDGRSVYISNLEEQKSPAGLNCSGFVKWLTDGILYPITGEYLHIENLKDRMLDYRGSSFTINYEESQDPFFGLDWSRALAKAAWSTFYPERINDSPLDEDVNNSPFTLYVPKSNPLSREIKYIPFADNFDDAGIDVKGLKAMLFILAVEEPGRFYLAQFNTRAKVQPRLRKYFHIAALFPYFDENGIFKITVLESAEKTEFSSISKRGYEFVKLIRMPVSTMFEAPKLKE